MEIVESRKIKVMTQSLLRKIFHKNDSGVGSCNKRCTMNERKGKSGNYLPPRHEIVPTMKDIEIIGPTADQGIPACPCCRQGSKEDERKTIGETRCKVYGCVFDEDGSETESCESYDDMDEEGSMMPGVLSGGVPFVITKHVVQGWIFKKGSGADWIGSRAWKARWAVLSLAKIYGHEADVPILQIFWHPSSPSPSTVIHLDSAIILPEDLKDKTKWNAFRFQVRHVRKSVDEQSVQITRIFSCPKDGRDAWCQAISQALLVYEKEKANARKQSGYLSLSPTRWRSSSGWATGDAHPSNAKEFPPVHDTPPPSPRSPPKDLPRHEPSLIGECLLATCLGNDFD